MSSVLKNEKTIIRYIRQSKSRINVNKSKNTIKIISHLKNLDFWTFLKQARDIFKSIHQIQYFSEAEDYSLIRVLQNWNKIQTYLYFKVKQYLVIKCLKHIVNHVWKNWMFSQFTSLHVVAALLLSWNHDIKIIDLTTSLIFNSIMMNFFEKYINDHDDVESTMKQWLAFKDQINDFHSTADCWKWTEDSKLFWLCVESFASQLFKLALRVNRISDNSVLAERDWSIMNLIKTKTRNSLNNVNVDKLMYIYMNERTLNRSKNLKKKLRYTQSIEIDEKKLCEMKNKLLQKELTVARLNPSNDEVLKHFLNSFVDGHMFMEQPI
jgi:hypothetical protein